MFDVSSRSKILVNFILGFSLIGILDAGLLTYEHYTGGIPPCSLTNGCEAVTTSQYSLFYGVPVSLVGLLFYIAVFVFMLLVSEGIKRKLLIPLVAITGLAFLSSLALVYLQLFIIKAICIYCMLSAFTSTMLFILSVFLLRSQKQNSSINNNVQQT